MKSVELRTSDGVKLVADYWPAKSDKGVLLLHMMPATKESWHGLAPRLQELGWQVLAIDLRGHGQSEYGPGGYKAFPDEEHQASRFDVSAAVKFLVNQGVGKSKLAIIGASIGANLAINYQAQFTEIPVSVLLSAGLNYHGLKTEEAIKSLKPGQKILLVSSEDDGNNASENRQLKSLVPKEVDSRLIIYQNAGHGTDMLGQEEPDLATEIIKWF